MTTISFDHPVLATAAALLQAEIAPQAELIDRDPIALQTALGYLAEAGLLGLQVPQLYGGLELQQSTYRQFQELVARYSGALAFLQAQHQSAAALLGRSPNRELQQAYLSGMARGEILVGISFAHLRRQPSPVTAITRAGGYVFQGQAPWVTGWGSFRDFMAAAVLPDGQVVYGLVPFQTQEQQTGGALLCSQPLELAAMTATATVTVEFRQWFVPEAQVVQVSPLTAMALRDRRNVLNHSFFALGCARAGLDILAMAAQQKPLDAMIAAHTALQQELQTCRQLILAASPDNPLQNLKLRAWAIDLAVRCAHGAVIASSGAANQSHHPAQRVYREALMFSVAGQTTPVLEASLERLVRQSVNGDRIADVN